MEQKKIVYFFCILLFGLSFASMLKKPTAFSEKENRYLASKPSLSVKAIENGSYMEDYETFITDQFVFRDQWIGLKTKTERLLLKQEIKDVYFGKDDYLIEHHSSSLFTSAQAQKNISYLTRFVEKINGNKNVSLQVAIVPTASQILTDKLPLFATPYDQTQFLQQIEQNIGSSHYVDVLSMLQEKNEEEIYYKTDHHYTMLGAYYTYVAWANAMSESSFSEHAITLTPMALDDFKIDNVSNNFYGTIASKVSDIVPPDTILSFTPKQRFQYKITDETKTTYDSFYNFDALKTRDKYTFYLRGNHPYIHVETTPPQNTNIDFYPDRHLLVIKDSFAHCFLPFVSNHFSNVTMIDLRYYKQSISKLIEDEQITDILILYSTANFANDKNINFLLN